MGCAQWLLSRHRPRAAEQSVSADERTCSGGAVAGANPDSASLTIEYTAASYAGANGSGATGELGAWSNAPAISTTPTRMPGGNGGNSGAAGMDEPVARAVAGHAHLICDGASLTELAPVYRIVNYRRHSPSNSAAAPHAEPQ